MTLFESPKNLVAESESFGTKLALSGLKAHQLRRVYEKIQNIYEGCEKANDVQRLNPKDIAELQLLKPWLAYAAKRKPELRGFQQRLVILIDSVGDNPDSLKELYRFVQAVLAYHKASEK